MLKSIKSTPSQWVKDTLVAMTIDEKLGQLIASRDYVDNIEDSISRGFVGGIYVRDCTKPETIEKYQQLAKVPLLISVDMEGGSLYEKNSWSAQMALGAVDDIDISYQWAYRQALEARDCGINSVYGPVLDIAMNPNHIHTGSRALSGIPKQTAKHAVAVIKGFQDGGLLPFAKHFPGFGRGCQDPHMELSICDADRAKLFDEDLLPYIEAIKKANLAGIMTGHIKIESLDKVTPMPLSPKIFSLLDEIGFEGLTITDSLAMKGISLLYPPEMLYPACIAVGHDMILANYAIHDKNGHDLMKKGLADGVITEEIVNKKVERILKIKECLMNFKAPEYDSTENRKLFKEVSDKSVTLLRKDRGQMRVLKKSNDIMFLVVPEGGTTVQGELAFDKTTFPEIKQIIMQEYPDAEIMSLHAYPDNKSIEAILQRSGNFKHICMIVITGQRAYAGTANFSLPLVSLTSAMRGKVHTFISVGNPYAVKDLSEIQQILISYGGGEWVDSIIKVLSGKIVPVGKLPVSIPGFDPQKVV